MAMHHVIVINTDRLVQYDPETIGQMILALTRTCGGTQERVMSQYYGITYTGNSENGFHRALENAARDFL